LTGTQKAGLVLRIESLIPSHDNAKDKK